MVDFSFPAATNHKTHLSLPTLWLCIGALAASIVLGGNTMTFSSADAVVEALCLPALAAAVVGMARAMRSQAAPAALKAALAFCVLVVALPLVQLIPLPPAIWAHFPGRAPILDAYRLANVEPPWLGLSMSPAATLQSVASLAPALAVFLLTVQLNLRERRLAAGALIVLAVVSALVGFLQLAHGAGSPLRFYYPANVDIVGFFANHNHLGILFYLAILMSGVWGLSLLIEVAFGDARSDRPAMDVTAIAAALLLACVVLIVGAVLTRSRAVVLIGAASGALVLALTIPFTGPGRTRLPVAIFAIFLIVGLAIGVNYAAFDLIARIQMGLSDSIRADIADLTRKLIAIYFPTGSGFGTFLRVYAAHETPAMSQVAPVNRAHNDYLEWLVEGSAVAGVLIAIGVGWVVWMCARAIRNAEPLSFVDGALRRAAAFGLALTLIHSTVEYPLRTIALMAVAALLAGLCVDPFGSRPDIAHGSASSVARRRRRKRR